MAWRREGAKPLPIPMMAIKGGSIASLGEHYVNMASDLLQARTSASAIGPGSLFYVMYVQYQCNKSRNMGNFNSWKQIP